MKRSKRLDPRILVVDSEHEQNTRLSLHTTLGSQPMSLVVVSCMLFLLTLAHSNPISTLFLLALPLAILIFVFRSSTTQSQVPEKPRSKSYLPEVPSYSPQGSIPMPSISYQPPVKVLEDLVHTAPFHLTKEQFPTNLQVEAVAVKQPYDAFLVLDVEATCFQGTGFEWPNEIIVRRTFTHSRRRFLIT